MARHGGGGSLITQIVAIVVLAALVNGLGPTLIDSVNDTTWGPITATLITLIANIALGLVLLFAIINFIRSARHPTAGLGL